MTDEVKRQILETFEISPDDAVLLEPTSEEIRLKADQERYAAEVGHRYQELAGELSALLPPGMEWVIG